VFAYGLIAPVLTLRENKITNELSETEVRPSEERRTAGLK